MLGMAPTTFRRRFCGHQHPRLPIIETRGPRGVRRILMKRADVEALIESMTVRPAHVLPGAAGEVLLQKGERGRP